MNRIKRYGVFCLTMLLSVALIAAPPKKKSKTPKEKPIKHYIDLHAGGGVSSMGYALEGGSTGIGISFTAGMGYTWFFLPYMGLQTGVSVTRLAGSSSLSGQQEWRTWQNGTPLTDYTGDIYVHRSSFADYKEAQQAYLVQVPLGFRFRYFRDKTSRAGLHAALGASLSIPVLANYKLTSGTVTHSGWYEQWQLELHDLPGRFETETVTSPQEENITSKLHTLNGEAFGELGVSIRLNQHSELFIAAYGRYMLNNFSAVKPEDRVPLGFANSHNGYSFMSEYHGIIGTDRVSAMHPWAAGLKVGVSIWPGKTDKEKKRQLKKLAKEFPDALPVKEVHDTIYLHDTLLLRDTVYVRDTLYQNHVIRDTVYEETTEEVPEEVHVQLDAMLSEAVIWFELDSDVPILEPEYILDSVATMMKQHPGLRIHVNGHACKLGKERYNKNLALRRAQAVAVLLEKKGVPADRMFVWSYGAKQPYRYNSEQQLSKDRRVEIIPDKNGE